MKSPPTLADACVATALDKNMAGGSRPWDAEIRGTLLEVLRARKFVLDPQMSAYVADLSRAFWHGGLRKRFHALENARRMARLPHAVTFIEFDFPAFVERNKTEYGVKIIRPKSTGDEPFPSRVGWLVRQHPKIETAFISTEISSSLIIPGRATTHPVSITWCSDDNPLMWPSIKLYKDEPDGELLMMMTGYRSSQVAWTQTWSDAVSVPLMVTLNRLDPVMVKPSLLIRDLWALLATINDLPIRIEHVEPSHGYMTRGSYKKFLKHSVVHLTVPETRWRKLVYRTSVILRKRAHQVRGHWREDWRNPLTPVCEHEFNDAMVCNKCKGHKIWITEHQRGDAGLGFVTHDYEVHKAIAL
jgi:hypothetical protein